MLKRNNHRDKMRRLYKVARQKGWASSELQLMVAKYGRLPLPLLNKKLDELEN